MKIATDALIFGIYSKRNNNVRSLPDKNISVLLVKYDKEPFKDKWVLPGGFITKDETLELANDRIILKETGLKNVYTRQLITMSNIGRDPRDRVISTSFISLIDINKVSGKLEDNAKWFKIDMKEKNDEIILSLKSEDDTVLLTPIIKRKLIESKTKEYKYKTKNNELGFDHDEILMIGLDYLRKQVSNTDLIFTLMPLEFTIGELKQVYEIILGKTLINSAFRRKIAHKLIETETQVKTGGHRPSTLYKFNENYDVK